MTHVVAQTNRRDAGDGGPAAANGKWVRGSGFTNRVPSLGEQWRRPSFGKTGRRGVGQLLRSQDAAVRTAASEERTSQQTSEQTDTARGDWRKATAAHQSASL